MSFQTHDLQHEDIDDNDILDELENEADDEAFSAYRAQRTQELARLVKDVKRNASLGQGYGDLTVVSEREFFDVSTSSSSEFVVVLFSHPNFERCEIMSRKLRSIAQRHYETRFVKVDAPEAPFLTAKLGIKVLPCVIGYVKGQERLRIVGFEGLSRTGGDFNETDLEAMLARSKLIKVLD